MTDCVLEMKGIRKAFDASQALKNVDFALKKGEIHALIGENGAGKTTLMNILGGVVSADVGQIFINGCEVVIHSPADSKANGIAFIHQELNLVNDLTIYENMFLGSEILKHGVIDAREMSLQTEAVLKRMNVTLNPKSLVKELDASYKQVVEIARALRQNSNVIIMDEPTTSLTEVEIQKVFKIMVALKNEGVSIVFISHKLKEVIAICDSFTVLCDGEVVANGQISEYNNGEICKVVSEIDLAKHMVGKDVLSTNYYRTRPIGDTVIETEGLSYKREFANVSFQIRKGEIVGFAGLLGDGRCELFECIFGCRKGYQGKVRLHGQEIKLRNTSIARKAGLGYVPRNRKENAIIKDMSILHNASIVTLSSYSRFGFINRKREYSACLKNARDLNIKYAKLGNLITSLSGGNQQKVVLAKWLDAMPEILIFDNPTQGVDVGAKNEIYNIIMQLAERGMSIVVLSSEASEIIKICDRVYVMYHGEIQGELERKDMTEENMMILATGGQIQVNSFEI